MDDFFSLPNLIGYSGVFLVLLAYYMLQSKRWKYNSLIYLFTNMAASLLIIVSLVENWNWPSFIIQSCLIAISLYGLICRNKNR